jgi:hypothetical protein
MTDALAFTKANMLRDILNKKAHAGSPELGRKWIPRTACREGYVIEYCKEYKAPAPQRPATPSATAITQPPVTPPPPSSTPVPKASK